VEFARREAVCLNISKLLHAQPGLGVAVQKIVTGLSRFCGRFTAVPSELAQQCPYLSLAGGHLWVMPFWGRLD